MTFIISKNENNTAYKTNVKTGVYISPPSTKSYNINLNNQFHFVDIAFHPGVFYELFKIPVSELENRAYNIEELSIKIDDSLLEKLYEKKESCKETVNILNSYFSKYFNRMYRNDFIENIKHLTLTSNLDEFYSNSKLSNRQIQRETKKLTGLNPKTIQRISRFYKILEQIKSFETINLSNLAQELDFYDQSHLIKEFKSFSGINLTNFMQLSSNYLQYQSDEYCHKHLSI
jgi:AraC-like DNA-binding protein